jgi:predicted transcriptional regulator YdeE/DNA-binding transcriptional MerR regulator
MLMAINDACKERSVLKIGDFSKVAHVTVKTLRHYAHIGLFSPAWTDRFSGYRYYTLQQLPRLNRILALKDLGFSLEQVADLARDEVPVEQLRGMLRRKQSELEGRLRAEQTRLGMVAARLLQIEQAGPSGAEVLLKNVPATPVAVLHEIVPSLDRVPAHIEQLVDELNGWLGRKGIQADGPWMTLYLAAEYRERDIPLEVAVVVPARAVGHNGDALSRARTRWLAAAEMACLVHTGPQETLGTAYTELYAWMEANHRRPMGAARELVLRDVSEDDQPITVIEIQIPVEPRISAFDTDKKTLKETIMEPKMIDRPAFDVAGLLYVGKNQNQEIAAMWGDFNRRAEELLPSAVPNTYAYGVCLMASGLPEGCFEYVAGFEVREGALIPEGMVVRHIPACKYAVFSHTGAMEGLRKTFDSIFSEWIPASGLEPVTPEIDIEVYTEEFKDFAPDSVFYIYVAVK